MPAAVEAVVVMLPVLVQVGEHAGNESAAPLGRPVTLKETDCVAPVLSVAVTVCDTELPAVTVLAPPLANV